MPTTGKGLPEVLMGKAYRWKRDRKGKRRPDPHFRRRPNSSAEPFHVLAADGQPQARSGILLLRVKASKGGEHVRKKLRRDADAIVANGKLPSLRLPVHRYVDLAALLAPVLQRIRDEILNRLQQERAIARDTAGLKKAAQDRISQLEDLPRRPD